LHLSIVACLVSFPPHFRRLLLTELRNAQQQGRLRLVGALESLHSMYKSVRALHLHQRETAARLAASATAEAGAGGVLEGAVSLSLGHNNGTGNDAGSSVPQLTHNTASFSSYTSGSGSSTSSSGTTTTNNNSNFNHNSNSNSNPAQGTSASGNSSSSSSSSVQPRKYTKDDLVLKQFLVHGHARHISASKSAVETVGKLIHSVEVESSYNDILRAHPEFAGMSKMMLRQPGYSDWQWPFLLNRYVTI
jgi:hypothetical protein